MEDKEVLEKIKNKIYMRRNFKNDSDTKIDRNFAESVFKIWSREDFYNMAITFDAEFKYIVFKDYFREETGLVEGIIPICEEITCDEFREFFDILCDNIKSYASLRFQEAIEVFQLQDWFIKNKEKIKNICETLNKNDEESLYWG